MRTLDLAMSYGEVSQIIFFRVAPATDSDSQSDRYSMWRPDNVGLFATIGFVDPLRNYSGWWLTYPSEKYENQWEGLYIPYIMENKTCSKPPPSFAVLLNSGVHRGPLSPQQASGGFSVGLKPAGRDVSHGGRTPWPVLIGGSLSKTGVTG